VVETGKALERIVDHVMKINGLVSEIAASAQEQSTGLNEVNMAVNQMDQVAQQNAAAAAPAAKSRIPVHAPTGKPKLVPATANAENWDEF
jgi:methyl-accepting chemotaxis protein